MSSQKKSPKKSSESLQDFYNHHDSGGDVQNSEILTKNLKQDRSENAMLRSRIEEQGQLICYLKQRADHQLKRLTTLEEVNNELHLLRTQAQEESRERYRTCQMLERRFHELSENHEEMIKIKDEYKRQCHSLTVENKALKDQIKRNFSETINERNKTIENLSRKLAVVDEKFKLAENRNESLQIEVDHLKTSSKDKITRLEREVESMKKKNDSLTSELKSVKQHQKQQANKDNEHLETLRKEKEKLLNEVMERGKLIQERQNEVDEFKKEAGKKDAKIKSLIDEFNQKKDLVNSNLRVQNLKAEKEKLEEDLAEMERNFAAFRLHSQNLLEQEKDLNSKLRNNMLIR